MGSRAQGKGTQVSEIEAQLQASKEAIERVKSLHQSTYRAVEKWAEGYRYTGDHCAFDGEHWPCLTIRALESPHY